MTTPKLKTLVHHLIAVNDSIAESDLATKELKAKRSEIEEELSEALKEQGLDRISSLGKTVFFREQVGVSCPREHRDELKEILTSHGLVDMIQPNITSLKPLVKEWMDEGGFERIPDDIRRCLTVYPFRKLSIRNS